MIVPFAVFPESRFRAGFEVTENLERFRPEFGGRSLQQEHNRTQGMVRSPAQDQACKLMGEGQR